MFDISVHKNVHFIGIGGISMSALAHILISNGANVSGSDCAKSNITDDLEKKGAIIYYEQVAENIKNPDVVVYTAAISDDNPELIRARECCEIVLERADFLGELMKSYEMPIAICGTHGKTTTTSMVSSVFLSADLNPTIMVGGEFNQIGGNLKIGSKKYMIFEACEYVDSFLKFNPFAEIVLNVDADHLDYFSGIEQIKESFGKFMKKAPKNGFVIINADDENALSSAKNIDAQIITYGKKGEFHPENILFDEMGRGIFDIYKNDTFLASVHLGVVGEHNVSNALATYALAHSFGIDNDATVKGIEAYTGTKRRFEKKGEINGALIIDDYAHHPTEIEATLKAAKNLPHNKVYCIFQPHTYTRTKALLNEFSQALSLADEVIVTDIYAAREKNTVGIYATDLADKIDSAKYIGPFEDIAEYIKANAKKDDVILTMGAGTVTKLSEFLK